MRHLIIVLLLWGAGFSAFAETMSCDYRFAGDNDFAPYEYLDANGESRGFNVDIIRAVARETGLSICLMLGAWHDVRAQVERGDIDGLIGMYESAERAKAVDFSAPHLVVSQSIFVRDGTPIQSVEDLQDRTVVVQNGDLMHDYIQALGLAGKVVVKDSSKEVMGTLALGQADAALVGKLRGLYIIEKEGLKGVAAVGPPLEPRRYGFAVAKDNAELLAVLNEGLAIIRTSGEYQRIYEKWFGQNAEPVLKTQVFRAVLAVAVLALFVAALVMAWNRTLRRKVAARTETLRESENHFRTIIEAAPDAIVVLDVQGKILDCNSATLDLYAMERSEIVGCTPADLAAPLQKDGQDAQSSMLHHNECALTQGTQRFEWIYQLPNGRTFVADVSLTPSVLRGEPVLIAIKRDATLRMHRQQELEAARNRALEGSKAKSRFLAAMSHELRTPLNAILGFAQVITQEHFGPVKPARYRDYAAFVETSGRTLLGLVEELLDFSHLDARRRQITCAQNEVAAVVRGVFLDMGDKAKSAGVNLVCTIPEGMSVFADQSALRQILVNLVDNAVKFSNDLGQVSVTASGSDGGVLFDVCDDGIGIPKETLDIVFDPFEQAYAGDVVLAHDGVGLGLAIVRELVLLHGGRITIDSEVGKGTCVHVWLPDEGNSAATL